MTEQYRFTKTQAATFLAISEKTLDRRVVEGKIPAYREGERKVIFLRDDLIAYAKNHTPAWEPQGATA